MDEDTLGYVAGFIVGFSLAITAVYYFFLRKKTPND